MSERTKNQPKVSLSGARNLVDELRAENELLRAFVADVAQLDTSFTGPAIDNQGRPLKGYVTTRLTRMEAISNAVDRARALEPETEGSDHD